ncbi:MAG TPA: right-handed parallel beta-helix repeat-containing protein [Geminicoccaceae bacterium]|nr:right-handed parallel beta-helix repeat-containing protein [Geminicoccaceae bacterium]
MVDRRPQDFPNGTPNGVTDNTLAIQAAIDAWQPGDQVVISGGIFRTSNKLSISANGLILKGDGAIRAFSAFPANSTLLEVTGAGVAFDTDGLTLDQADVMDNGNSIRAIGAVGLQLFGLISRGTQRAFLCIEANTTDLLLANCDHLGKGYGVLAPDPPGVARVTLRDTTFEHFGSGSEGDGVQFNCETFGASFVDVLGCTARNYIGEANGKGIGFGFSGVSDGRLIGCRALQCRGDGFHLENNSNRWLCADLISEDIGIPSPVGGNGSGLIAYDSDDITVVLMLAKNCGYHGIALSGQSSPMQRLNAVIERCTVETTRRDGIHMTAQKNFRIDRNWVRDPSNGNPGQYAAIHVGRQGATSLENMDGTGAGNVVVLSGSTMPLGEIVIRPASVNVIIDGESGGEPWSDGTFWADGTGWAEAA